MAILELKNVSKWFGDDSDRVDVLHDIDLAVEEGEFVAIVGFSGSGKSTLISLMAGLEFPNRGEVTFRGETVEDNNNNKNYYMYVCTIRVSYRGGGALGFLPQLEFPPQNFRLKYYVLIC